MTEYSSHTWGSGPVLALAHGAGGGVSANFADLAQHLPARTLTGLDYPGSGTRPAAEHPLELAALADELVETRLRAGHDRFPILGLSMGTAVAVTAAARHPEHVTGLVLTVGFATIDAQGASFAALYAHLVRSEQWDALARVQLGTAAPAVLGSLTLDQAAEIVASEARRLRREATSLAPQMDLVRTADVRVAAATITVPSLVIGAGQDRIVLPRSTRQLAEAIPGAEYVELSDAGHTFTPTESPEWAARIRDFLTHHGL